MRLTVLTASFLPFILAFALYLNKRMKRVFKQNRVKMADINGQIEDNLSGIRVVKSFANEAIEMEKFKEGNDRFLGHQAPQLSLHGHLSVGAERHADSRDHRGGAGGLQIDHRWEYGHSRFDYLPSVYCELYGAGEEAD